MPCGDDMQRIKPEFIVPISQDRRELWEVSQLLIKWIISKNVYFMKFVNISDGNDSSLRSFLFDDGNNKKTFRGWPMLHIR